MTFLCSIRPSRPELPLAPTDEESALVAQHFLYLKALFEAKVATYVGRTEEAPFVGLLVFEAEGRDAAQAIVEADPAIAAGVFMPTLSPFKVIFS
jgi:uncharacterized protein